MNLKNIRDYTRYRLNDYEKIHAWLDVELNLYANEAEKIICRDGKVLEDSTTDSICNIDVEEDTLDYELDETIIYVTNAKLTDSDLSLTKKTKMEMDRMYPGWRDADSAEPSTYILDYRHGYITLYPPPDDDYTLNLSVIRYPQDDMALDTDEPEIPVQFHHAIIDGICYQAYLKWGDRTYDAQKSDIHLKLFRKAISDMKIHSNMYQGTDATMGPHGGFI
jgi:hypothetical protein